MNTPSLQVSLEHGAWFGNLAQVPRPAQKKFVELIVDAHCDLAIGESIQHIYSTLAILQQALYTIIDEDAPKLGTWKKKGSEIIPEKPNTWTVKKGQLNDAFSMLFYQIQDAWQCSSDVACKQIMEAYKDKTETKPYPITLMRQTDKDACIKYFVKDTIKHPPNMSSIPPEAKTYLRDNPSKGIISVPTRLCHWLFPETRAGQTAAYAQGHVVHQSSYQTYDEVRYLSQVKDESQLASPYRQKHLQYNCGRCKLCRKVWRARIKREIRHYKRHGGRAVWIQRDKSRYGPQHKEVSELEKCINMLVTKWQKQDGITPSQPVSSPFHTCPMCNYKMPTLQTREATEEAKAYHAAFDLLVQHLAEEDRKKQMQDFKNDNPKAPPYIRPVSVSTSMMEGDWHSQGHDVLKTCQHDGKVWAGRTIFEGLNDDSSASSGDDEEDEEEEAKNPKARKVHFPQEEEDWIKVDGVDAKKKETKESKDTIVESKSLSDQKQDKKDDDDDDEEETWDSSNTKKMLQLYVVD